MLPLYRVADNSDRWDNLYVEVVSQVDYRVVYDDLGCFRSAQYLRCNSIERSLRVALVISSLLIMDLYTGRSPMSIQILAMRTEGENADSAHEGLVVAAVRA